MMLLVPVDQSILYFYIVMFLHDNQGSSPCWLVVDIFVKILSLPWTLNYISRNTQTCTGLQLWECTNGTKRTIWFYGGPWTEKVWVSLSTIIVIVLANPRGPWGSSRGSPAKWWIVRNQMDPYVSATLRVYKWNQMEPNGSICTLSELQTHKGPFGS